MRAEHKVLPKLMFDKPSLAKFCPNDVPVVYFLYKNDGTLVRFGASATPRTRLLAHLREGKDADFVVLQIFRNTTAMARCEKAERDKIEGPTADICGVVRRNPAWKARKV